MNELLQDLSAPALSDALEKNWWELVKLWRPRPQVDLYVGPDIHWLITGIPLPFFFFNGVGRANLTPGAVDAEIEAAIGRGRSRNVPISWSTGPTSTRPSVSGADLERHGFTFSRERPGMAADLSALNHSTSELTGLVIERVGGGDTLKQFSHTAVLGLGLPASIGDAFHELWATAGVGPELPLRHYLGWLDGKPVATSSLMLGAGVGGIYIVATVPEARRKGIGAAMTLAPCHEARDLGYRVAVLGATKMGFGVYQKLGFREICRTDYYVWKGDTE